MSPGTQTRREEIIKDIINDAQYRAICENIAQETGFAKDLYQEVMIVLLEYNPYKLRQLYCKKRKGQFRFFFARVAMNIFRQKYYVHYKRLAKSSLVWLLMENMPAVEDGTEARGIWLDRVFEQVMSEIRRIETEHKGSYPFNLRLFQTYLESGTLRQLEKETGISYNSCYNTITKLKKRIQQNVSLETHNTNR